MWKKNSAFCERAIGSTRTEMTYPVGGKFFKELGKWRNALAKAIDNQRSGENLSNEIIQAQMWFGATGQGKKSFNHTHCWEVVKTCKRFQIIPTGPTVVLNETPLHEMPASDSLMDSPMSTDSPIEIIQGLLGGRRRRRREGELSKHQAMRIEMDLKQQEHDMAVQVEYAKEREYVRKEREYVREQNIEKKDRETMAMDTSHMSPETKQFWKLERRDVMRRRLFRDNGPSNTNCFL
ncbi:Long-chain fatty alcohol dehydrogenase family protein, partial [Prunus dulcis]